MAINQISFGSANTITSTHFVGRVMKVEEVMESRNWSDTLDYTDFRTTKCTYALVWLGEHGVPPRRNHPLGRLTAYHVPPSWHTPRDLELNEQFAWVDCTNIFADRCGYSLAADVDADLEPMAQANLIVWEHLERTYQEQVVAESLARQAAAQRAMRERLAAKAARETKKAAKLEATKGSAEVDLARLMPLKGKQVTLKSGITGNLFWMGIKAYRGVNSCRLGVRDAKGNVTWAAASDLK